MVGRVLGFAEVALYSTRRCLASRSPAVLVSAHAGDDRSRTTERTTLIGSLVNRARDRGLGPMGFDPWRDPPLMCRRAFPSRGGTAGPIPRLCRVAPASPNVCSPTAGFHRTALGLAIDSRAANGVWSTPPIARSTGSRVGTMSYNAPQFAATASQRHRACAADPRAAEHAASHALFLPPRTSAGSTRNLMQHRCRSGRRPEAPCRCTTFRSVGCGSWPLFERSSAR